MAARGTGPLLDGDHLFLVDHGSCKSLHQTATVLQYASGVERVVERIAGNPLILGAAAALSFGIGAGSGPKAREHGSCKRQVSGSNPLTGSTYQQVRDAFSLVWRDREPEPWNE